MLRLVQAASRAPRWLRWAVVGVVAFLGACAAAQGGFTDSRPWGDTGTYDYYGGLVLDGKVPYHDFTMEYPPGGLPVFILPRALRGPDVIAYLWAFKPLMVACGVGVICIAAFVLDRLGADRKRMALGLGAMAVGPGLLGEPFLNRYDLWPALLTITALALVLSARPRLGSAVLAASFAAKIYAMAAVPAVAVRLWRTRGRRTLVEASVIFALVCVAAFGYFLVVAFGGLGFSFYLQTTRHLQTESLAASLLLAADHLGLYNAHIIAGNPGSVDLGGRVPDVLAVLTSLLELGAIAGGAVAYLRGPETRERFLAAFVTCVAAFTVLAKVISPQFLVWLVALVPLVGGRAGRTATLLLLVALCLTQADSHGFEGLTIATYSVFLLATRNLVLVTMLVVLLRGLVVSARPVAAVAVRQPAPVAGS
jgi:hypothetical protein